MKALVKKALLILGHALGKSIHDRLDHVDHALDVVIEQNNSNARAQTGLLQSSIHSVNALDGARSDLAHLRNRASAQAAALEGLRGSLDRIEAQLAGLSGELARLREQIDAGRQAPGDPPAGER
jgi:chromosome segregation ATPase